MKKSIMLSVFILCNALAFAQPTIVEPRDKSITVNADDSGSAT